MSETNAIMKALSQVIASRRDADPQSSYVASLLQAADKKAAQKVAEEGVEVAIAAVSEDKAALVGEMADLLFHLLVLCEKKSIDFEEIMAELQRREGVSGHEEKAARK